MIKLPKIIRTFLPAFFICVFGISFAQPSFTISSSLCTSDTATLTAGTGIFPATGYQWSSSPSGPVFSAANSSLTQISFPAAGVFTITLGISLSTITLYTTQVVAVHPVPTLTLSSTAASICAGQSVTLTASGAASYTWNPTTGLYFFSNSSAYVSPNVTGVYSIVGSSLGCVGTTSYTVDVKNYPNLVLTASSTSICPGFNSTLTANGATTYSWMSSTFTTAIIQQTIAVGVGTYSLIGANGICADTSSVIITTAPPITLTVSASRNTICVNDGDSLIPVHLSAAGATLYSWEPYSPGRMTYSIGATTAVSPSVSTCYTLTGTTAVCLATTVVCVNISTCTSLEEIDKKNLVNIFPNPVLDKLFFTANSSGFFTIKIRDIMGKLMLEKDLEINSTTLQELNLDTFIAGIYFVYVVCADETPLIVRVVKQ